MPEDETKPAQKPPKSAPSGPLPKEGAGIEDTGLTVNADEEPDETRGAQPKKN